MALLSGFDPIYELLRYLIAAVSFWNHHHDFKSKKEAKKMNITMHVAQKDIWHEVFFKRMRLVTTWYAGGWMDTYTYKNHLSHQIFRKCVHIALEEGLIAAEQEWENMHGCSICKYTTTWTVFPPILNFWLLCTQFSCIILSCQPLFVCRLIDLVVIDGEWRGFLCDIKPAKLFFPLTSM